MLLGKAALLLLMLGSLAGDRLASSSEACKPSFCQENVTHITGLYQHNTVQAAEYSSNKRPETSKPSRQAAERIPGQLQLYMRRE